MFLNKILMHEKKKIRTHPMCFQVWVYWRGFQFRVAFSAFVDSFCWSSLSLFSENRRVLHSFTGFFPLFRAFVLLLVASVVRLQCCVSQPGVLNFSVFAACFLQQLLPLLLFAVSLGVWQSLSVVFLCLHCLLLSLVCFFSEPDQCFACVSVCRLQHGRSTTVSPRDCLLKTCHFHCLLQMCLLLPCAALACFYQRIRLPTL